MGARPLNVHYLYIFLNVRSSTIQRPTHSFSPIYLLKTNISHPACALLDRAYTTATRRRPSSSSHTHQHTVKDHTFNLATTSTESINISVQTPAVEWCYTTIALPSTCRNIIYEVLLNLPLLLSWYAINSPLHPSTLNQIISATSVLIWSTTSLDRQSHATLSNSNIVLVNVWQVCA